MSGLGQIWVYLATRPLLWLTVTLAVFSLSVWVNRRAGGSPLLHPVLMPCSNNRNPNNRNPAP